MFIQLNKLKDVTQFWLTSATCKDTLVVVQIQAIWVSNLHTLKSISVAEIVNHKVDRKFQNQSHIPQVFWRKYCFQILKLENQDITHCVITVVNQFIDTDEVINHTHHLLIYLVE